MLGFPQAETLLTHLGLQYPLWCSTLCLKAVLSLLRLCHSALGCVYTFLRMLRLWKPIPRLLFMGHSPHSSYLGTNILQWAGPHVPLACGILLLRHWQPMLVIALCGYPPHPAWVMIPEARLPPSPMWMHHPLHLGVDIIQPTVSPKNLCRLPWVPLLPHSGSDTMWIILSPSCLLHPTGAHTLCWATPCEEVFLSLLRLWHPEPGSLATPFRL